MGLVDIRDFTCHIDVICHETRQNPMLLPFPSTCLETCTYWWFYLSYLCACLELVGSHDGAWACGALGVDDLVIFV